MRWSGLLIGNGASIAVADSFGYQSLFEVAREPELDHPLSSDALNLFSELSTTNFEFVLGSLQLAARVTAAIGTDASRYRVLYEQVQEALFEAVATVHVDWSALADVVLARIRRELLRYRRVYSTNYDLLTYWAMMCEGDPDDFRDFFWTLGGPFDAANTEVWGNPTVVHFLHGGLHLRRTEDGRTFKQTAGSANLLSQFTPDWNAGLTPLLVSEGTSADKLQTISRSDYLLFVYSKFASHKGNLVIFGHGLGDEDEHLVHAMNRWGSPWSPVQIAISVRSQSTDHQIRQAKARLAHRVPHADLWFYDADLHPLGQPNVRVP